MSPAVAAPKRKAPAKTAGRPKARSPPASPPAAPFAGGEPPRMPPVAWQPAAVPAFAPAPPPVPAAAARPSPSRRPRSDGPASGGNDFVRSVYEVARKEVLQHIRTKRLLIIAIAMALLLGAVTLVFGPNIAKNFESEDNAEENLILAFYFGFGLIGGLVFTQLLSIVLTSDAVCSEWSNRTIFLLLSKPVSRAAFTVGKFVGNLTVIAGTITILFTADYLLMQSFYSGAPDAGEWRGFFLTLLVVILGCAAYAAISLFFSTLTRSTIQSTLLTLAMWIIILPLIGSIGLFTHIGDSDVDFDDPEVQATLYFNPNSCMQTVTKLLLPNDNGEFTEALRFLNFFNPAPKSLGLATLSLSLYTVVFFAASILVVQRRNFE
jgi:ABC-type transport system involved in multi-copper enzyme maturation permease subunit